MRAANLLPPLLGERHMGRRRARRLRLRRAAAAHPPPRIPDQACSSPDIAVERARRAGGPIDNACYSCQCGCVFAAAVSTTVACPHCGTAQAW